MGATASRRAVDVAPLAPFAAPAALLLAGLVYAIYAAAMWMGLGELLAPPPPPPPLPPPKLFGLF